METIDNIVLDPLEDVFDRFGLDSPLSRAAVGAGLGSMVYVIKPNFAFKGKAARPWKVFSKDSDATWFPAWMVVVTPAVLFGVLV